MDAFNSIIASLEKQKAAIEKALAALLDVEGVPSAAPAERVKRKYTRRAVKGVKAAKVVKKSGGISEEGRMRLREAMKARWIAKRAGAAVKKARKKSA